MQTGQSCKQVRLATAGQHLGLLNPDQVLARGYSLVQDSDGRLVCDAEQLATGDALRITFAAGWAKTEVTECGR
jgi:exodeoxyribonuclease VII large subunit